jgi:hypothetical protein
MPIHPAIRSPPRRGPLPMLPSNARPLVASIASGVCITAAITIAGIAALAAFETAADGAAPNRSQTAGVLTLADVPHPNLHTTAPGPHATDALSVLAGKSSSAGDTRARSTSAGIAKRSTAARPRRTSTRRGRTQVRRPATSAPHAPASANAPAAANAAPADSAATATGGRAAVRTSDSTSARPRAAGPGRGRQHTSARGRGTNHSAGGQTEPSTHASHPGRSTTRGQRPVRARGKAIGHREPVVAPQPTEPAAPSSAPPASPPGHANGHGKHADPPGADRGRGRGR